LGSLDKIIDSVTSAVETGNRFKVGEVLKGDKRLEDESYEDFKIRRKVEKGLVKDYLKGRFITDNKSSDGKNEPLVTKSKEGGRPILERNV
jgi:hypothetical protein|tara:strand:- start:199 stop:471 length:273 start_codon:yes stop_codon:yes gene_type:complete